ncbi:MAG: HAD hydrolase-like protein, partial [Clostridia bacterium]|nr:HAD hydrolase-like protein [Clostridia bacterium]
GKSEFIMVGDRLHTDIKFGNNCGFYTALVLSGESTADDIRSSDAEPDFIFDSLNDVVKYINN